MSSEFFPQHIKKVGAFALSNDYDQQLFQGAVDNFRQLTGVEVVVPKHLPPMRQFAGVDQERAELFNAMVADPSIQGMIAIRGGSGVGRVLEMLDFQALGESGKFLCGYSDVTALLLAAAAHNCTNLIHGPMFCSGFELPHDNNFDELDALSKLFHKGGSLLPSWHGAKIITPGQATGKLFVANLTLLQTLIGTKFMPNLHGAILVLEDVNAPAHDIDRKLNHLRQAGILKNLAAIVFGQFTKCEDDHWLSDILHEYALHINGPALWNMNFGHIHPSIPLPCNVTAKLEANLQPIEFINLIL